MVLVAVVGLHHVHNDLWVLLGEPAIERRDSLGAPSVTGANSGTHHVGGEALRCLWPRNWRPVDEIRHLRRRARSAHERAGTFSGVVWLAPFDEWVRLSYERLDSVQLSAAQLLALEMIGFPWNPYLLETLA